MTKAQKTVIQAQFDAEKKVIRELEQVYRQALKDVDEKIRRLSMRSDMEPQRIQTIIYQRRFQEAIKAQLEDVLEKLHTQEYATVSEYLEQCYQDGYIGVIYDLQGQGIPLILPIDQEKVTQAIQVDSKLSKSLYDSMGEDVNKLKTSVRAEVSRGIANGSSWNDMAAKIAKGMKHTPFQKAFNRALNIARTEGHRIQTASALDAQRQAKAAGADVVKQWNATLDGVTRTTHRMLDGQIRNVEEDFEVNGKSASAPGHFGDPAEDCNCRCVLLQRAKWALDEDELKTLQERAEFYGLDKTEDFEEFKRKYLKLPENADKINIEILNSPIEPKEEHYKTLLDSLKLLDSKIGCAYNPVKNHAEVFSEEEIIKALAGGDRTQGSCASVALSYVGQKQGWNVLDFRDGESRHFFSSARNLKTLSLADGIKTLTAEGKCSITVGNRLLKQCEAGKEYYLCVGRHAAIVRRTDEGVLQYLELQSAKSSGWTDFDGNPRYTLSYRFGCTQRSDGGMSQRWDFMMDLDESNFNTDEFKSLLGYINTVESEQRKGEYGTIK